MQKTASSKSRIFPLLIILVLAVIVFVAANRLYYKSAYPTHYKDIVVRESLKHDLALELVFAIIHTESGFRPQVQSSVGARGLMQITEDTFDWIGYRMDKIGYDYADLYNPEHNIEYGTALLRLLLDEFGSVENALCAYHAGWGSVKRWLSNPETSYDGENIHTIPFGDTKRYVEKVISTQEIYKNLYQFGGENNG